MARVYLVNAKDGKKIEFHYRIHKIECINCKKANDFKQSANSKVKFCDKHNKCKSR